MPLFLTKGGYKQVSASDSTTIAFNTTVLLIEQKSHNRTNSLHFKGKAHTMQRCSFYAGILINAYDHKKKRLIWIYLHVHNMGHLKMCTHSCTHIHRKTETDWLITATFTVMTCKIPIKCRLLFTPTVNCNVFTVSHSELFLYMEITEILQNIYFFLQFCDDIRFISNHQNSLKNGQHYNLKASTQYSHTKYLWKGIYIWNRCMYGSFIYRKYPDTNLLMWSKDN